MMMPGQSVVRIPRRCYKRGGCRYPTTSVITLPLIIEAAELTKPRRNPGAVLETALRSAVIVCVGSEGCEMGWEGTGLRLQRGCSFGCNPALRCTVQSQIRG